MGAKIGSARCALSAEPGAPTGKAPCQAELYHDHRGCHNKKARLMPRSFFEKCIETYFLNFLLRPTSPTRPEPSRKMVEGSGMGEAGAMNSTPLNLTV